MVEGVTAIITLLRVVESVYNRLSTQEKTMAFVVTENCIKCKFTDCVEVCPVDCFYEGPNFLAINPDECIDCALCEPECPSKAIFSSILSPSILAVETATEACSAALYHQGKISVRYQFAPQLHAALILPM